VHLVTVFDGTAIYELYQIVAMGAKKARQLGGTESDRHISPFPYFCGVSLYRINGCQAHGDVLLCFQSKFRFMHGLSSSRSAADQVQPILSHADPRILQSPGFQRVYDAFHLLQTVPSVQVFYQVALFFQICLLPHTTNPSPQSCVAFSIKPVAILISSSK